MNSKAGRISLLFLLLLGLNTPVFATQFVEGNWKGGAYRDNHGNFSYCGMSVMYNSGISLMFTIDRNFGWALGISKRRWRLQPDSKLNIALLVDNYQPIRARATVISSNLIFVPLSGSDIAVRALRRGHLLTVVIGDIKMPFHLKGTYKAISRLARCVTNHVAAEQRTPDYLGATESQKRAQEPQYPRIDRAKATVIVSNALANSGVSGFRIIPREEHPSGGHDVVWTTSNGIVGTVSGFKNASDISLNNFGASVISIDAKSCEGEFVSGQKSNSKSVSGKIVSIFTACDNGDNSFEGHYTLIKTPNGTIIKIMQAIYGDSVSSSKESDLNANMLQSANWLMLD